MAEGFGVKTSEKEGTGILWLVGAALAAAYLWSSDLKDRLVPKLTDASTYDWLSGSHGILATTGDFFGNVGNSIDLTKKDGLFDTTGDWLSNVGSSIDLTDSRKYDWLAGSDGIMANTGEVLSDAGSFIDLTDSRKYDWLPW